MASATSRSIRPESPSFARSHGRRLGQPRRAARARRVPKVVQRETRGISAACHGSSHAQMDRQPGYHGPAMGNEAVRFLVHWITGWINSRQLEIIAFLREENRVLREQLGGRR